MRSNLNRFSVLRIFTAAGLLYLISIFCASPAFSQLSSESYKPVLLSKNLIQSQKIKSVMAMFQINTADMEGEENFMPRRENYESYKRNKDSDLRKLLFFTSLGSLVEYDKAGNLKAEANLSEKSYTVYEYNDQDKVISQKEIDLNYPTSSDSESFMVYKFDKKGNQMGYISGPMDVTFFRNNKDEVTSWKVLQADYLDDEEEDEEETETVAKTSKKVTDISDQYQFDKQGRILKQQNSPDYYDETQYSEKPKTTTMLHYAKGELKEKRFWEYDKNNRVIKQEFYKYRSNALALYSTTNFDYDDTGNLVKFATTNALEPAYNQEIKYKLVRNKDGLPLKREVYLNNKLAGTEIFFYEHY